MKLARHQARAERAVRWLRGRALLAGLVVIGATDLAAALLWPLLSGDGMALPGAVRVAVLGGLALVIFGGAALQTLRLRRDPAAVARRLGAAAVGVPGDPLHRRVQNLLEELSIAARIGVPRAFVLEDAPTIDAWALGMDRDRAVIVVTRGALTLLARDELKAVLAHEIAHVAIGDARLNTELIGMTHGLQSPMAFGRALLARARSDRHGPGLLLALPIAAVGSVACLLGWPAERAAWAVRGGLGRRREQAADALAITLTGEREPLGSALRKVLGQRRTTARPSSWHGFGRDAALRDRVRRVCRHDAAPIDPEPAAEGACDEPELPQLPSSLRAEACVRGPTCGAGADRQCACPQAVAIERLMQATRDAAGAAALLVALFERPGQPAPQWAAGWSASVSRHPALRAALQALPPRAVRALRSPLIALAAARLRTLSRPAREALRVTVCAHACDETGFEPVAWVDAAVLRRRLVPEAGAARRWPWADPIEARSVRVLFALLAQCAQVSEARADRAANAAIRALGLRAIGGSPGPLTPESLERALAQAAALPALDRPLLLRRLAGLLPADTDSGAEGFDLLRALAAALGCPPPKGPAPAPGRGAPPRIDRFAALPDPVSGPIPSEIGGATVAVRGGRVSAVPVATGRVHRAIEDAHA